MDIQEKQAERATFKQTLAGSDKTSASPKTQYARAGIPLPRDGTLISINYLSLCEI
ncbi:hypothetical protein PJX95_15070 [Serratia rubidaea]|uniref:hypothetical protein n=1 Tax=Serratia rubidaea TaxID=61652 RepID=UPI00234A0D97|nr:hypothetical protein [Serratia rubidaea]MDC6119371.1 hypothetical protein [Serratia rubidaea]